MNVLRGFGGFFMVTLPEVIKSNVHLGHMLRER